ncbi:MAG: hypothetical protein ACODAU_10300 [Myxococcota bacterium]
MAERWIRACAGQAGPLGAAAEAFDAVHGPFERAGAGLRRLARVLEQAMPETEEEDRRLVEGAGALLSLLLIDHLGVARHRARDGQHRLQLGARGFFDPFEAVEDALEADDVRACLAEHVARAEAEARGAGPTARVACAFERALARLHPERQVAEQFELQVWLDDGTEVDLTRIARADDEATVATAAERLVSLLPGATAPGPARSFDALREHLLPRLVGETFLEGLDPTARPCTVPLGHDVHLALVVHQGDRARYVRDDEVGAWPVDPPEARRLAIQNLASLSAHARFGRFESDGGPIVVARTGDGHDAARLVLPGLHDVLAAELTPPIVAAVPHRDILLATSGASDAGVAAMARRAAEAAAQAPHRISARLFQVQPGGVEPWT